MQPVPWVFAVATRSAASRVNAVGSIRRSTLSAPTACPPLMSTARAPSASRRSPCSRMAVSVSAIGASSSAAASGRFGVTTSARGISTRLSTSIASGASSLSPEVAIMTGSSTTWLCRQRSRPAAMVSMTPRWRHHADLDRADLEIGKNRVDLRGDEFRRHVVDRGHALGVLRGQGGDHRGAVDAKRGERLEVGLDAGAAAGIGARQGDRDRRHRCCRRARATSTTPRNRVRGRLRIGLRARAPR